MQQAAGSGRDGAPHGVLAAAPPGPGGRRDGWLRVPAGQRPAARHARPGVPGTLAAAPAGRRPAGARPPRPAAPQIVIAGAHGGAGVTTLAALLRLELAGAAAGQAVRIGELPPVPDADPARIAAAGWLPVPPPGAALIITARGTAEGARRAVIAVTALERRAIRPVAVAVVADGAGPEPRQAAQRFGLICDRCGPLIRVPFAAALRAGAAPGAARLPRRLYSAVYSLAALAAAGNGRERRPC